MTKPKWAASQEAVEAALTRGPQTVGELAAVTGYSMSTIRKAVERSPVVQVPGSWPHKYRLGVPEGSETPVQVALYIRPEEYDLAEVGARWQEGKKTFGTEVAKIDLYSLPLDTVRERFQAAVATMLGVLIQLDKLEDGPEWRSEIGL